MNVDITGARIYFTIPIFGGIPITATIVNSLLVTLIIIGLSIFLTRNLKVRAVSRRQVVAEFLVAIWVKNSHITARSWRRFSHRRCFPAC